MKKSTTLAVVAAPLAIIGGALLREGTVAPSSGLFGDRLNITEKNLGAVFLALGGLVAAAAAGYRISAR